MRVTTTQQKEENQTTVMLTFDLREHVVNDDLQLRQTHAENDVSAESLPRVAKPRDADLHKYTHKSAQMND
jgi:hypothetical protein